MEYSDTSTMNALSFRLVEHKEIQYFVRIIIRNEQNYTHVIWMHKVLGTKKKLFGMLSW